MTVAGWFVYVMLVLVGGWFDTMMRAEAVDNSSQFVQDLNAVRSSAQVLAIDDAQLDAGPLNTGLGIGAALNPFAVARLFDLLSFDYIYLRSYIGNYIRYILQALTTVLIVLTAFQIGPNLFSAIRGRVPA